MEYLKLIEDKEGFVHWDGATEQEIEYGTNHFSKRIGSID